MTKSEFKTKIQKATKIQLARMGFMQWMEAKKGQPVLMLIPGKLFKSIPEGYTVYSLSGKKEKFSSKTSDDDVRLGCLPYGVVVKN